MNPEQIENSQLYEIEIPEKKKITLTYAVEQRLRLIDFLVFHYGEIGRGQICDYYGISLPQASADLKLYMQIAPENLIFSFSKKCYLRGPEFKRVWR